MSVDVLTFGCRLNAFESEVIAREAERAGFSDTVVINSCAVTNEAVAQARQSIRRLKRERPDVRIVVTGSCITEIADFGGNAYSVCTASKGGIVAMMKPIAAEVARHGITVNAVSPGYIGTDMVKSIRPDVLEKIVATIPVRRLGTPEEIGSIVTWLASDEAGFSTGADFSLNGGLHMG